MTNAPFFTQFLKLSNFYTVFGLVLLLGSLAIMKYMKNKRVNFSKRMIYALILGLILGIVVDLVGSTNEVYTEFARTEINTWYALVGSGFLKMIQLLAIPVVFLSIIKVVVEVKGERLKHLTGKTFATLLGTTAISALLGILVVKLFQLNGAEFAGDLAAERVENMTNIASQSFPEFFLNLVPNNIISVMGNNGSIVSVVIISRGIQAIMGMIGFIAALYTGIILMLIVYVFLLMVLGVNPWIFYKKAFTTLLFAFSSHSSVGTLPYTLKTLNGDLGVSLETSNFVATLGTSIGMNGCAGVFPAMLGVLMGSAVGAEMNLSFYILVVVVVTVGSIGIAGVPGTATVAATVTLNGLGFGHTLTSIGAIFGIDPIVDMGRTMLNVAGAMVSAIMVDKWEGTFDKEAFLAPVTKKTSEE